jgi:hypothetical protein
VRRSVLAVSGAKSGNEVRKKIGTWVIIRCTADPAKADKRTRSKWSRGSAVRGGVQAGVRAFGAIYSQEGRHQRVRCSFHAVPGAGGHVALR